MFLISGLFLILFTLTRFTKQTVETEAKPTPVFNYGEISVRDQIALDLNEAFNANIEDTNKIFRIQNNAARITSSKPFNIVEFQPHCIKYNSAYQDPQYQSFSAICNKNELFEIKLDKATSRIVSTEKIVTAAGTCHDSRWSKELNIYTLFCEEESQVEGNIGDIHIHTIDRTAKVIIGSQKISKSVGNYGMAFTEKSIISQVKLPSGSSYSSQVQFLIYDQPYIDETDDVKSKANLFFLIFGVDQDNKPQPIRYIDIKKQGIPAFNQLKKVVGIQHMKFPEEHRLMITGYFNAETKMKTFICSTVAEPSQDKEVGVFAPKGPHFSNCSEMQTQKNLEMGQLQFFAGENYKMAFMFNKLNSKIKICKYDETNASESLSVCTEISSRISEEPTLEFAYFDRCTITECNVVYIDSKKVRYLGIDHLEITDSPTSGFSVILKNRFKTWAKCARIEQGKLYISKGNYLEAYNDKRSERLVVLGSELPPASNFHVVVEKLHQEDRKLVNITGYRIEEVLMPVKREIEFPKLEGQVGRMYKLPFSRKYFTGNDLTFKLSNSQNIKTELSYINPVVYQLDKKDFSPKIAIIGLNVQVFQTTDNRWVIAKCYFEVETGTIEKDIKCSTIREGQLQEGEEILNIFEDSEAYVFLTQKGRIYTALKKANTNPVIFEIGEPIVDLELKRTGDYTIVAVITESNKIKTYIKELFNNKPPQQLGDPIIAYEKEAYQNTPGEFCPKMLTFKLQEKPRLIVLNACADKDRRIIEYDMLDAQGKYGLFYKKNSFILSSFFMSGNLKMCAGLNNLYIANLDGKQFEGIGYEDSYTIEDLGVDFLRVNKIRQITCSGENNIGMVAEKSDGVYITTFFTKKFAEASDRIHSSFKLPDGVKNVRGSSDNKRTIYSVEFENGETKVYYVNLKGPHIHVETAERNHADYGQGGWIIGEVNLKVQNEKNQNTFSLTLDFRDINEQAAVSSKSENFEIEKNKEYTVDDLCEWDGPVFGYTYTGTEATVTQRLGNLDSMLTLDFIDKSKIQALDHIEYLNKHVFGMGQMELSSYLVIINTMNGDISEIDLKHRCSKISVAGRGFGSTQPTYDIQAVCLDKGLFKLAHIRVDVTQSGANKLILMNFAQNTQNVKNFDLARLDDELTLSATVQKDTAYLNLAYYDPTKVVGDEDFAYTRYYEEKNGKKNIIFNPPLVEKVQLIDEGLASDNIFMMYSQAGAQEISLKMISKKSKAVVSKEKLNIEEIGSSTIIDFDCHYNKKDPNAQEPSVEDTVWCVFAVPTTFIHKVVYNKNLFTGLMMASKSKYYLYSDTYPIKIKSNSLYIVVLAKSPKTGMTYLLIYKDHQKNGSQYLYSGVNLSSKGLSDGEKLVIDITDDNIVLVTSRKDESLLMKLPIQEMKITVLSENLDSLKESKILFNKGTDYPEQEVPIKYFFIPDYKQERVVMDQSSTIHLWVLLVLFLIASFLLIIFMQFNQRKMARQIIMSGVDTRQFQKINQQAIYLNDDSATTYYVQEMPGGFY